MEGCREHEETQSKDGSEVANGTNRAGGLFAVSCDGQELRRMRRQAADCPFADSESRNVVRILLSLLRGGGAGFEAGGVSGWHQTAP